MRLGAKYFLLTAFSSLAASSLTGCYVPAGVWTQGDFQITNNPLDLAIAGDGFFEVRQPDGTAAYTRQGAFKLDGEGRLVTKSGLPIVPPAVIPPGTTYPSILSDGGVFGFLPDGKETGRLGSISLVTFSAPSKLQRLGDNLYAATLLSGPPKRGTPDNDAAEFGSIRQGALETLE